MKNFKLFLASKSPRRKELLSSLGFEFEIIDNEVDESFPTDLQVEEVAAYISKKKAEIYKPKKDEIIITADTVVIIDQEILGKPINEDDAFKMLKKLNGKSHLVITAFTLVSHQKSETFSSKTEVMFNYLSDENLKTYVKNFKPLDKAGSYGIQEWIGLIGISKINGSYTNVMGLPTDLLFQMLNKYDN